MTTYKKSSVRHYTHYMSLMPGVLEFYPDDIRKIADNNEYVSRGLGDNQFLVITTIPGSTSNKPSGYTVQVFDPSNGVNPDAVVAQLEIKPNQPFVYCHRWGKPPELYVINVPTYLKDKVAWALGATRNRHEKRTINELRDHYEALLTAYVEHDRTDDHTPQRYTYKSFEAVVSFKEDGVADRNNSAYYIKGWPPIDECIEVLNMARRRDGWFFSSISKIDYVLSLISPQK